MIKVSIVKENSKYKKISILGHAMYDDYGKDIVCSACSSIVTTTVNGVLALQKGSLSYMIGKKGMTIDVKSEDETTQILIHNMVRLLKELEGNYRSCSWPHRFGVHSNRCNPCYVPEPCGRYGAHCCQPRGGVIHQPDRKIC